MEVLNHEASDELAVHELVARFSDAVNRRVPSEMAALWAPDGVWVVPGVPETVGRDAIAAVLTSLLETFPSLVQMTHNGVVRIDGDEATARWYLSEFGKDASGQGVYFIGTYHDRYRRTEEGWRFAHRRFDFLYRGKTEAPGKFYPYPEVTFEGAPWPA